jgi:hypothetical protein
VNQCKWQQKKDSFSPLPRQMEGIVYRLAKKWWLTKARLMGKQDDTKQIGNVEYM